MIRLMRRAPPTPAVPPVPQVPERLRRVVPLGPGELLVEATWGGFMVIPAFNLDVAIGVARDGVHEAWTTRLVQELLQPGDVYLNAGANFGYFVCLAGRLVGERGRVIGVEPNPHILPFLMKSIYWNGSIGITEVIGRALSDTAGQAVTFHFDPQYLGGGTLCGLTEAPVAPLEPGGALAEALWGPGTLPRLLDGDGRWVKGTGLMLPFAAETTTVDRIAALLDLPRIDLLHLDIEGAEPLALLGARDLIARSPRLRMITEWSAGHYARASSRLREAFDTICTMTLARGWKVRRVEPRVAEDGGLFLSPPLTQEALIGTAEHGDYLWTPPHLAPFN
jgi:FkbM family methyltransferase